MRRKTAADLLEEARRCLSRLTPQEAREAMSSGALLIDLRSVDERNRSGVVPGSLHIPRSVLEWRVDPDSGYSNPAVDDFGQQLVLFCADGFSSSFAAVTVQRLGYPHATDMIGGFTAWTESHLPVRAGAKARRTAAGEVPGMGSPEPL